MKLINDPKTGKKLLWQRIFLILGVLIVPYLTIPVLTAWWFYKKSKFSHVAKVVVSWIFGGLFLALIGYCSIAYAKDVEPQLNILEPEQKISIVSPQVTIKGTYDPVDRRVWINGKEISASNGSFETTYQLKEGENIIEVTAGDWKRARVSLVVTRELTDEEKAARATPTPTPKPTSIPTQAPSKIPEPTPKVIQATPNSKEITKSAIDAKVRKSLSKEKIKEIQIVDLIDGGYGVYVSINGHDNLSNDLIQKGIWLDMASVYTSLYGESLDVRQSYVKAYFDMIDKYGNTNNQIVMKTMLNLAEAQKVNWRMDHASLGLQILPNVWDTSINIFK